MVFDVVRVEHGNRVQTEPSRDSRLTEFGKVTLSARYPLPGESFHGRFARLPACHGGAAAPAPRPHHRIGKLWFMPATPIRTHGGPGDRVSGILDRCNESPGRPPAQGPWQEVFEIACSSLKLPAGRVAKNAAPAAPQPPDRRALFSRFRGISRPNILRLSCRWLNPGQAVPSAAG